MLKLACEQKYLECQGMIVKVCEKLHCARGSIKEKVFMQGIIFILYILRFSHQILLCEKAFRILLRPIREVKRVSHT